MSESMCSCLEGFCQGLDTLGLTCRVKTPAVSAAEKAAVLDEGRTVMYGERGRELLAAEFTLLKQGYTYEGGEQWKPPIGQAPAFNAPALLDAAAKHMRDRAATYDKPEGERSMGKTVEAFNTITGRDLRESEGWLLMALLKMVRSETGGDPHRDSIEDLIAYSALFGEARIGGK